jgi:lambda repressor-like predicted transcriptional regulator
MSPLEIQFALKKRGSSQREIATMLGIHPVSVSKTIWRKNISDRVMRAIAQAIGEDHRLVWPEYYLRPPLRKHSKANVI